MRQFMDSNLASIIGASVAVSVWLSITWTALNAL